MVRVAIVLHGLGANGIDTLFSNLSECWDYNRFEITYLLAVDEGAEQFWEDKVVSNGVRVIHLHDLDKKRIFKWPVTLKKALKEYGPFDVIHVNMDMLNGINLAVAKRAGISNRICHAHRSSSEDNKSFIKRVYISIMRKMMIANSTCLLACSDTAGQYFYGKHNFNIIFNGIKIDKYKSESAERDKNSENNSFITVGRFTPQKNPLFLIEVFYEIKKNIPDASLSWIGEGVLMDQVREKANTLQVTDSVSFLGIRNNVDDYLKKADYFLMPSLFEGLSLALAEAQAAGLDCFVSDTVSKMSDCGKCMFIPLNKSANEWAQIITEYIHSEKTMKVDLEKLDRFDITTMGKTLMTYYL